MSWQPGTVWVERSEMRVVMTGEGGTTFFPFVRLLLPVIFSFSTFFSFHSVTIISSTLARLFSPDFVCCLIFSQRFGFGLACMFISSYPRIRTATVLYRTELLQQHHVLMAAGEILAVLRGCGILSDRTSSLDGQFH